MFFIFRAGGGAQVKALADKSAKNEIFFMCSLRGPCYLHFLKKQKIKGEKNRHLYKIYVLVNFGEIKKYFGLYKNTKNLSFVSRAVEIQMGDMGIRPSKQKPSILDSRYTYGDTPHQADTFHPRLQVYMGILPSKQTPSILDSRYTWGYAPPSRNHPS